MKFRRTALLSATALVASMIAVQAAAQESANVPDLPTVPDKVANPQAGQQAVADAIDTREIIVSARKRQESILRVPVIETVLTSDELQRTQVTELTDVASLTPGLILGLSSLEVGTQVSIRGIGTTALDPGIDQSIALNLDGLQVTQGSAYSVGVFDMAQIEVLKGPQSLFYGKNSPGGVIAIRTADPGDELEFIGRLGHEFIANEWRGEAIISGPISDTFGLRLAALYSDYGGYFRNTATAVPALGAVQPPRRFGATKTLYLRGTALFRPSSAFRARLKLNYTRDRQIGGATHQLTSCPDGLVNYAGIPFYSANEDCKINRNVNTVFADPAAFSNRLRKNGRPFTSITQKFGSLELDYDIQPDLTLSSVTGYYKVRTDAAQNGTYAGAAAPALWADKHFGREEFTQEFRLNSEFSSPLNFTVGAFYQDGKITNDIFIPGNLRIFPPAFAVLLQGTHDVDIKSVSAFGQLRYKVVPEFEIAAGVRWTHEKRSDNPTNVLGGVTTTFPVVPKLSSKNWSPELTLTYTPTDDLTVFGSIKQAYKSGSYNLIVPVAVGQDHSFGDERIRGAEIGIKSRFAERQIYANLAFYYYKYKGLQVGINEAAAGSVPILRTVNAGSAKIYGVDFDLNFKPSSVPGLDVRAAVNWNHARFTQFVGAPCWGGQTIAEGCNLVLNPTTGLFTGQDLTGEPLTRAPDWQLTAGVNYEMPVGRNMTLGIGASGNYSSKYLLNLGLSRPDFYQKAFAKIGANVSLKGRDDAWEVALIGNNLTDKLTSGSCTNLNYAGGQVLPGAVSGGVAKGPSGSDELICTFDRGREVWLRLTLRPAAIFGSR